MFCSKCGNILNQDGTCNNCNNIISNNSNSFNKKQKNILLVMGLVVVILFISLVVQSILGASILSDVEDNGPKTRTIMIYMVGSNLESESHIASSDIDAIDEEFVDIDNVKVLLYTGGTTKWHNFVSNEENAIYELKSTGFEKVKTFQKLNMGDASTLAEFINYSYDNYKTDKYNLVFYNHGGAIDGAIYDDFSNDNLSLVEFKEALDKTPFKKSENLETILFRTCLNGTLEIANIFEPYADYLIASEEVTNGSRITSVLNYLNDITPDDKTIDYGKKFIAAYDNQMQQLKVPKNYPMMYSIIDLSKMSKLKKELNKFISSIDLDAHYSDIVRLRANLYQFGYSFHDEAAYDMVDLYSLIEGLSQYSTVGGDTLLNIIDESIVYNWSTEDKFHGLSVYFPFRGSKMIQQSFLNEYSNYDVSSNYTKFISSFSEYKNSNKTSSFANFSNKDTVKVENKNEFSLTLTDQQRDDYADSYYILFNKQENGLFKVAYSSDNAELSGNTLKTNISNNLIKIVDKSDNESDYLMVVERMKDGKKSVTTGVVFTSFADGRMGSAATTAYFDFDENNEPYVSSYVTIGEEKSSGAIINPEDYDYAAFLASDYQVLDENGNYTGNLDNQGVVKGYELKIENLGFKRATLDDNDDYYCVFAIMDIYGNIYYSKFLHLD